MPRLRYLPAALLLLCACAAGDLLDRQWLVQRGYGEDSTGAWRCGSPISHRAAFWFDSPQLKDIISCVAEEQAAKGSAGDFVLQSGSSRYKCRACDGTWLPLRFDPREQRPLRQCGSFRVAEDLEEESQPQVAEGGSARLRLDGLRCYVARRKGCDRGFAWCHGNCCRQQALLYSPQQQQAIGTNVLLTSPSVAARDEPLLQLLATTPKTAGADS